MIRVEKQNLLFFKLEMIIFMPRTASAKIKKARYMNEDTSEDYFFTLYETNLVAGVEFEIKLNPFYCNIKNLWYILIKVRKNVKNTDYY